MKSFFRIALLCLALLILAMVSALTTMRLAIHAREVNVPNFAGKTAVEARKLAEDNGLQLEVERQYYSADVPEGKLLSQAPSWGTKVRRGWTVRVAQSLGPQRVAIPNVTGESERAAGINIRRRGLDLGSVARMQMPGTPADQVLSQSPPPNASGVAAPKISLLVAEPAQPQAFLMPNFVGQPLGSVRLVLQDAGMRVGNVTIAPKFADRAPNGLYSAASLIESQKPAAGERVTAGAAVDFEVR
jgi:eukaryotic-like serine/threonine-protein kinase